MSRVFTTGFGRREVLEYRTGPTPTLVFANRAQKQYHEPHWKKNTGDGDGRFQTGTTGPAGTKPSRGMGVLPGSSRAPGAAPAAARPCRIAGLTGAGCCREAGTLLTRRKSNSRRERYSN